MATFRKVNSQHFILGGRIRGQVAQIPFDEFHKHSAQIIQTAVCGLDQDGNLIIPLKFAANNLVGIFVYLLVLYLFSKNRVNIMHFSDYGHFMALSVISWQPF